MKHILALLLFSVSVALAASPSFDGARISNGTFTGSTAISGTMAGNFTRSGTTTGGTTSGETNLNATISGSSVITGTITGNRVETGTTTGGVRVSGTAITLTILKPTIKDAAITPFSKIVFQGDSLTSASGPSAPDTWPAYFVTYPETESSSVTNLATSGDTAQNMWSGYASEIGAHVPSATESAILFLLAGTNDVNNSRSAADIYEDLKDIWAEARGDGFTVCAFTVPDANVIHSGSKGAARVALNVLIRSDPTLYDYLIDLDSIVQYANDAPSDLLHYEGPANKRIAQLIRDVVFYGGAVPRPTDVPNRALEAAYSRDLPFADRTAAGTGATGLGTWLSDGRSGGFWTGGDTTTKIYVPGPTSILGATGSGQSIDWAQEFVIYAQFDFGSLTNGTARVVVGLKTSAPSDITTESGYYAGIEWRNSGTAATVFSANNTTPTTASVTTLASAERRHVWIHNLGGGSGKVDIYHAVGFRPQMPATPIATVSAAPTGAGGSGCSFQLVGSGTGSSGSGNFYQWKLFIP